MMQPTVSRHSSGGGGGASTLTPLALAAAIAVWYVSASLSVIGSSVALNGRFGDLKWVALSLLFTVAGGIPSIYSYAREKDATRRCIVAAFRDSHLIYASGAHLVGILGMCVSFSTVAASTSQVIKASEPIFTAILWWTIRGETLSKPSLQAVVLMSTGIAVACCGGGAADALGLASSVASAVFFPLRNVLISGTNSDISPIAKYGVVSALSAAPALLLFVVCVGLYGVPMLAPGPTSLAVGFHVAYMAASFVVLGATNPITHSVANVCKRLSTIVVAHVYFSTSFKSLETIGFSILTVGFMLYIRAKSTSHHNDVTTSPVLVRSATSLVDSMAVVRNKRIGMCFALCAVAAMLDMFILATPLSVSRTAVPLELGSAIRLGRARDSGTGGEYNVALLADADYRRAGLLLWPYAGAPLTQALQDSAGGGAMRVDEVERLLTEYDTVTVLCADAVACRQALQSPNSSSSTDRTKPTFKNRNPLVIVQLVATDICRDTALETWFRRHTINKLLSGVAYQSYVESALHLCGVYRYGGAVLSAFSPGPVPLACNMSAGDICVGIDTEGQLHTATLVARPRHHLVNVMIEALAGALPRYKEGMQWPAIVSPASKLALAFREACAESGFESAARSDSENSPSNALTRRPSGCLEYALLSPPPATARPTATRSFGVLSYDSRVSSERTDVNVGDEVQAIPGSQFLPFIDRFLDRGKSVLSPPPPSNSINTTIFLNAWWGSAVWPPPASVHPILVSMHVEPGMFPAFQANSSRAFFANYEKPVGARDVGTLNFLTKIGVPAYFSACATLLMASARAYGHRPSRDIIYLVDVTNSTIDLLPAWIVSIGVRVAHNLDSASGPVRRDRMLRYSKAVEYLELYRDARLVITQRIHAGLPAVGMETPVLFINSRDMPGGGGGKTPSSRVGGLTGLFHTIDLFTMSAQEARERLQSFDYRNPPSNPSPALRDRLRASLWNVVRKDRDLRAEAMFNGLVPLQRIPSKNDGDTSEGHRVGAECKIRFHFIQTTGESTWTYRQQRSVESVLYHHPDACVTVHTSTLRPSMFEKFVDAGYDVRVEPIDVELLARGTPLEGVTTQPRYAAWKLGRYWYSHYTDMLRLLILYKVGGVYLDTDVYVTRSFAGLRNTAARELVGGKVNGAVLVFDAGNPFLLDCMTEFNGTYDGLQWAANGPGLITRVWVRAWMTRPDDLKVLSPVAFYMIRFREIANVCFASTNETVIGPFADLLASGTPYAVHLNFLLTGKIPTVTPGTLCEYLLTAFCVFCDEHPHPPVSYNPRLTVVTARTSPLD